MRTEQRYLRIISRAASEVSAYLGSAAQVGSPAALDPNGLSCPAVTRIASILAILAEAAASPNPIRVIRVRRIPQSNACGACIGEWITRYPEVIWHSADRVRISDHPLRVCS